MAYLCARRIWCFRKTFPKDIHTLEVTVGGKTESATVISAPEKIELLDEMKEGSCGVG